MNGGVLVSAGDRDNRNVTTEMRQTWDLATVLAVDRGEEAHVVAQLGKLAWITSSSQNGVSTIYIGLFFL